MGRTTPPVTTLLLEENIRLGAISELCLKLAGERDPGVLLSSWAQIATSLELILAKALKHPKVIHPFSRVWTSGASSGGS